MTKTGWIIFSVICVGVLGFLVWNSNANRLDVSDVNVDAVQQASERNGQIGDHVYGNKDAKVTLIEYADFQCPGCAGSHPSVKTATEEHRGDVRFIFRNFPLSQIHPNARAAASAAEAAGLQGKYWEMVDKLFDSQNDWKNDTSDQRTDTFVGYARDLGLSEDTFKRDMGGTNVAQKIRYDQALGGKSNVTGTPSFFLNGRKLADDEWNSLDKLRETLKKAVADAK